MHESMIGPEQLVVPVRTRLGESPWWNGSVLSWVDILGQRIHVSSLDGGLTSAETPSPPGFAIPNETGGWIVGLPDGVWHASSEGEAWTRLWLAPHDPSVHRLNDAKTDPSGRLWFGSMTYAESLATSALYRLDGPDASAQVTGIITSNGLGWSPDARTFYYTDSIQRTIWAFAYDLDTGTLRDRRVFAVDPDDYIPDGLSVDDEGCVWSCKWDGARIVRYDPTGQTDVIWHLPVSRPTSCVFAGSDRHTLAVTTATPNDPKRAAELDGAVLLIPAPVGAPLLRPVTIGGQSHG